MKDPDLDRRALLRGMLAVGCAALVPVLGGCERQRPEVEEAPAEPAAPPPESVEPATPSPEAGKVTKMQAEYQEQPNGDQRCDNCRFFIAESNTCEVVEGEISPQGWCKLWVAQPSPAPAA
jgi:hypothetical protein